MYAEVFCYPIVVGFLILFGPDMSSFVHLDNRKKYILILGKSATKGLDDTKLTAEKEYATNFSDQNKKFCLSSHYTGVNSYIFVNSVEIYKFKAKDSRNKFSSIMFGQCFKRFFS